MQDQEQNFELAPETEGARVERMRKMPGRNTLIAVIIIIIAAIVVLGFLIRHFRNTVNAIHTAQSQAISSADFSFNGSKGKVYLYPISTITKNKSALNNCGVAAGKEIDVGNYRLLAVHKIAPGIYRTRSYDLMNYTFTPDQHDNPWDGRLENINVQLTGHSSGLLALYQYETCDVARAIVFTLNDDKLAPMNFKSNQTVPLVITNKEHRFVVKDKDKIDTFIPNNDIKNPIAVIHWQFEPKDNLFNETGKDVTDKFE